MLLSTAPPTAFDHDHNHLRVSVRDAVIVGTTKANNFPVYQHENRSLRRCHEGCKPFKVPDKTDPTIGYQQPVNRFSFENGEIANLYSTPTLKLADRGAAAIP